jgi:hypothetical protein
MRRLLTAIFTGLLLAASPALAQVKTVDPNAAIDGDLQSQPAPAPARSPGSPYAADPAPPPYTEAPSAQVQDPQTASGIDSMPAVPPSQPGQPAATYEQKDVMSAAEGVFGKGAKGLAGVIEDILRKQGEPNAYIAGREVSGALVVGLRYGSGTLSHKVAGDMPIFWTGPSVGFDVGGDANKVFVLVYNLYDTEDAYKRFPGGEGRLYFVGGFAVTYLRRGNVVLIPVRLGVGWRAGINAGYMKITHKSRWLPF